MKKKVPKKTADPKNDRVEYTPLSSGVAWSVKDASGAVAESGIEPDLDSARASALRGLDRLK